jgi:glycosyltransferase involved in cell wall biosynthesis
MVMEGGESTSAPSITFNAEGVSVVHIVDNLNVGGTELNVLKISKALRDRGADVRVVLTGQEGPLEREYRAIGVPLTRAGYGRFTSRSILADLARLSEEVHRSMPTVVHTHDRYSNLAAALMPRPASSGAVYVASHRYGMPQERGWRMALRLAYWRADKVLANGPGAARIARRLMVGAQEPIVIPNFLEEWCFERNEAFEEATQTEIDEPRLPVVRLGFVGRLEPLKRTEWLLFVAERLRDCAIPFHLSVVGAGSRRVALEQLASEMGVSKFLTFHGELPRRPLPHGAFDILLLSSKNEGTPNTVMEAMACGVPVVATDVGGTSGVVDHGVTGLLTDANDRDAFVQAVVELASNEEKRRALGNAARQRAMLLWREDRVVRDLIELIYLSGL